MLISLPLAMATGVLVVGAVFGLRVRSWFGVRAFLAYLLLVLFLWLWALHALKAQISGG